MSREGLFIAFFCKIAPGHSYSRCGHIVSIRSYWTTGREERQATLGKISGSLRATQFMNANDKDNGNNEDRQEAHNGTPEGTPSNGIPANGAPSNGKPSSAPALAEVTPDAATPNGTRPGSFAGTGMEASKSAGEDEEIFSFFKKYVGLLTIVGGLPVITAGIDVIAPPSDAKKLSAISSFTCIIALGVCVLFKKSFASWSVESTWKRSIAPSVASMLLICGLVLTAIYPQFKPGTADETGARTAAAALAAALPYLIYLSIFPCFVGALGVTLMASYSQFHGARLEAKIDQKITDPGTNTHLKKTIENYISVLTASADSRIKSFSNSILGELESALANLNMGYVEVLGTKIEEMQKELLKHFKRSAFCVSDRDLKFWLNGFCEHIKSCDELIAKQYLRFNIDAVSKGTKVTRIFIFQDSDFNHNKADIVAVLAKHQEAGIGWAVLIHEELPAHLKSAQQSLDFSLLDGQSAVAVLSNYNMDSQRRLYVLLNVPGTLSARIEGYRALHQQLVAQCWLASKDFCDIHAPVSKANPKPDCTPTGTIPLQKAIEDNKDRSHALNFGSGKIIRIEQEGQIGEAIEFISSLRRKNMVYWGEVSSRDVIDLAGDWMYMVKGKELDGIEFEHQGTSSALIEDGHAYFIGVRRLTTRGGQQFSVEAPWTSSPIQFGDNGKMKYSSTISVNGEEFQGLGEIHFSEDRKKLKGKVHMIMGEGKLISADVEFHRRRETGNSRPKEPAQQSLSA
jgi:hypothetical protein